MITGRPALLLLLPLLLLPPACNRISSDEGASSRRVELRDARGQPRQVLYQAGEGGFRWTDSQEGSGRVLPDPGGGRRAQDTRGSVVESAGTAPGSLELRRPDGTALRLSKEDTGLRLGDAAGIPIARTRIEKDETLVRDAGGQVVLRARRAGGRVVVTDRNGAAVGFVVGDAPPEVAALVWLPVLSAAERALLLTTTLEERR